MRRLGFLTITVLLLGALAFAFNADDSAPESGTPTAQPGQISIIDWVDFIRFDGIEYLRADLIIDEADLDEPYDVVLFNVSKNVTDPHYQAKDGDAARLEAGTTVYTVRGYAPAFRLAARHEGRLLLYEVFANPAATHGADLLDIDGKVAYIGINSEVDGREELTRIEDAAQVAELVAMVLAAPVVDDDLDRDGRRFFVAFHLSDGTETTHAFWPSSGELSRGMTLPPEFADAVLQALESGS